MEQTIKTTFEKLSAINVNDRVEKKNGLTYLSWAWAWSEVKKACPDATYQIGETDYDRLYVPHRGEHRWRDARDVATCDGWS